MPRVSGLPPGWAPAPARGTYDVVIVGGAIVGSAVAWFTAADPAFQGRILVVERDPGYGSAATSLTNSCIRQQFSTAINVAISQFGVAFLRRFRAALGDADVPDIALEDFGYLYLAATADGVAALRANHALQARMGAGTVLLTPGDMAARFPFIAAGDILLASLGTRDEGYFDGTTMFQWWRRRARALGVEFVADRVTAIATAHGRVTGVTLGSGATVAAQVVVNAAGTRAAAVAAMAGLALPVEPRRRYTYVFRAETPLPATLPLTVDPDGFHVRSDGVAYMAGCGPLGPDAAVDPDDFSEEPGVWEDRLWPALAARIPAFERVRVVRSWVGHYDMNTLDRNAVIGPAPMLSGFVFANGFSGHGFQQAAAVGRGVAELICDGRYRTLDLSPLGYHRILSRRPLAERNVI